MKNVPSALLDYYASGETELAYGILIERFGPGNYMYQELPDIDRPEYEIFGFTSHDKPVTLDIRAWQFYYQGGDPTTTPFTFDALQGFDLSSIVSNSTFSVDNLEISTLDDNSFFNREDIIAGKWNNTFFRIFRYRTDLDNPTITNDVETLFKGWFGEFKLTDTTITIELRGIMQVFQQATGSVSSKTCRADFGDPRCNADKTDYTMSYSVTSVTNKKTFQTAASQPTGYYNNGVLKFTSGANKNLSQKVSLYDSGEFVLMLPMILDIEVGDTFTVIAGCDKTLETCKTKFNNVINFQGEPHRPSIDDITKT